MTLSSLIWWAIFLAAAVFLWHHHNIRRRAYEVATRHTQENGVILLDQTIILRSIKIRRSHRSLFAFERRFEFEFSSLGDERYKGDIVFLGQRQTHLALQPFKTPYQDEPLD